MSVKAKNLPINRHKLKEKAMQFAKGLRKIDFVASNGWMATML